jgi:phosphate:Na+ symporter
MGQGCNKMMVWLKEILTSEEPDREIVNRLFHREEVLDTIQDEIVTFMTSLLAGNVPHTVIEEGRQQLRMADEYESISDYITSIAKFYLKLLNQGHRFSESDLKDLLELHDLVDQHMCLIYEAVENRQPEVITKAQTLGSEIKHKAKLLHDKHIESLSETKIEPYVNVAYTATINSYRRVRDHAINLAEAFAGEK